MLMRELSENSKIKPIVQLIRSEIYSSKDEVAKHLKEHVYFMSRSNHDIKFLGVKYI